MFKPTYSQSLAKANVHRTVEDRKGVLTLESLTREQLVKFTRTKKVLDWLEDPEFVGWFFDADSTRQNLVAIKDTFVERLKELMDMPLGDPKEGGLTPKELLQATDLLAKLTGSYPSRAKVVFADKDLNDMGAEEVAAKIAEAKTRLYSEGN